MIPFDHILRKGTGIHKLQNSKKNIIHLMRLDDIKLSVKNEKKRTRNFNTINKTTIVILSHGQLGSPWPSLVNIFYRPLFSGGGQSWNLYRQRAAEYMF